MKPFYSSCCAPGKNASYRNKLPAAATSGHIAAQYISVLVTYAICRQAHHVLPVAVASCSRITLNIAGKQPVNFAGKAANRMQRPYFWPCEQLFRLIDINLLLPP
jgi:hypothetical protein